MTESADGLLDQWLNRRGTPASDAAESPDAPSDVTDDAPEPADDAAPEPVSVSVPEPADEPAPEQPAEPEVPADPFGTFAGITDELARLAGEGTPAPADAAESDGPAWSVADSTLFDPTETDAPRPSYDTTAAVMAAFAALDNPPAEPDPQPEPEPTESGEAGEVEEPALPTSETAGTDALPAEEYADTELSAHDLTVPSGEVDEPVATIEPAVEPETEPAVEPTPEPVVEPEPTPATPAAPEPVVEPAPEPVVEPAPEPESTPVPEPDVQPEPEPLPATEPDPAPNSTPEPAAEPAPEPLPSTEPEPQPEPDSQPEPVQPQVEAPAAPTEMSVEEILASLNVPGLSDSTAALLASLTAPTPTPTPPAPAASPAFQQSELSPVPPALPDDEQVADALEEHAEDPLLAPAEVEAAVAPETADELDEAPDGDMADTVPGGADEPEVSEEVDAEPAPEKPHVEETGDAVLAAPAAHKKKRRFWGRHAAESEPPPAADSTTAEDTAIAPEPQPELQPVALEEEPAVPPAPPTDPEQPDVPTDVGPEGPEQLEEPEQPEEPAQIAVAAEEETAEPEEADEPERAPLDLSERAKTLIQASAPAYHDRRSPAEIASSLGALPDPAAERPALRPVPDAATPDTPYEFTFEQRRKANGILALGLAIGLLVTIACCWWAFSSRSLIAIGIAAVVGVGTAIVWAARVGDSTARLMMTGSRLTIERAGTRTQFDLADTHTAVTVHGTPEDADWQVTFPRRGMSAVVIDGSDVDPAEFMRVLRQHRPGT